MRMFPVMAVGRLIRIRGKFNELGVLRDGQVQRGEPANIFFFDPYSPRVGNIPDNGDRSF